MNGLRRLATHPLLVTAIIFAALPFAFPAAGMTLSLASEVVIYTLYAMGFNLLPGKKIRLLMLPAMMESRSATRISRLAAL